jgi:hypothetical protein
VAVLSASYTRKLIDAVVMEDHKAKDVLLRGSLSRAPRRLRNGSPELKVGARADLLSDTSRAQDTTCTPVHTQSSARVSPKVEIMAPRRKGSPRCGTFLSQATPESLTAGTLEQTEAAKATPPHKTDAAARKHLPAIAGWDKVCYSRPTSVCSSSEQRWPESMRLPESQGGVATTTRRQPASAPARILANQPVPFDANPKQRCRERRRLAW